MSAKRRSGAADSGSAGEDREVLATYCAEESDFDDELVVPCRSVVTLSASPRHASERRPRLLHTRDLDELKSWIGVPDAAVPNRCLAENEHRREMKALCRLCDEVEDREEDTAAFRARLSESGNAAARNEAIRAHARSYLFGDSRLVQESKPVVERFFGDFSVVQWLYPDILVKSGSVLAIGPGANVLLARNITIEEGGQIVSVGSLTARAFSALRKVKPPKFYAALDHAYVLRTAFHEVN